MKIVANYQLPRRINRCWAELSIASAYVIELGARGVLESKCDGWFKDRLDRSDEMSSMNRGVSHAFPQGEPLFIAHIRTIRNSARARFCLSSFIRSPFASENKPRRDRDLPHCIAMCDLTTPTNINGKLNDDNSCSIYVSQFEESCRLDQLATRIETTGFPLMPRAAITFVSDVARERNAAGDKAGITRK